MPWIWAVVEHKLIDRARRRKRVSRYVATDLTADDLREIIAMPEPELDPVVAAVAAAAGVSFGLLLATAGLRTDLAAAFIAGPVALKVACGVVLSATALVLSVRLAYPDRRPRVVIYFVPHGGAARSGALRGGDGAGRDAGSRAVECRLG